MKSREAQMRGRIVCLLSPAALIRLPFMIALLWVGPAVADNTWIKTYGWAEVPPETISEAISAILPLPAGDTLVAGHTESHGFGKLDGWIAKVDPRGNILWQQIIGTSNDETLYAIEPLNDGGYLLAGTIKQPSGDQDIWLIKLNERGDLEWQRSYGGNGYEWLGGLHSTADGNVLVAATTASFNAYYGDTWVFKLNSSGDVLWEHILRVNEYPDGPSSLITTSDGGAIVTGFCYEYYPYIVKLDSEGYIQWQKVLAGVHGYAEMAVQTADGGYVIGGDGYFAEGEETDIWIMKMSTEGEIQWQIAYGGNYPHELPHIIETEDGRLIFTGNFSINGNSEIFICSMDAQGSVLWQKRLGDEGNEYSRTLALAPDEEVLLGGRTHDLLGRSQMLLAKLDAQGQIESPCDYLANAQSGAWEISLTAYDNVAYVEESSATVQVPEVNIQPHGAQSFPLCEDDGRIQYLPAAASTPGAFGTKWKTEAILVNPSQASIEYTLYYTAAGEDGLQDFIPKAGLLQDREGVLIADLLKDVIGVENQAGSMRVVADGPIRTFTRTFNDPGGSGTYGQGIPLFERSKAISLGEKAHLIGIRSDDGFRSNIGFQEVLSLPTQVKVRFYDPAGTLITEGEASVPPYSWVQYPVSAWGLNAVEAARAEVEVLSGGAILAYASVADNRTGDPVFIPTELAAASGENVHQLIPIIARTEGAYNTHWRTDLWLFNPAPEPQTVNFTFYTADADYAASLVLGAGTFRRIEDPIGTLFPQITGDAFGSLHIVSMGEILAWSRIFHDEGVLGTYGQSVPGVREDELLSIGGTNILLPAKNTAEYRTNIGFTDFDGVGAEVWGRVYDLQGNLLGEAQFTVPPFRNIQMGLFDALGAVSTVEGAWVEVEPISGGLVMPYLSVVDNRTGDAAFVAMSH